MRLLSLVVTLALFITQSQCISWYAEPNTQKCLREEIMGQVPVVGEYKVSEVPGNIANLVVRDSNGHILAQKTEIQHGKMTKFAFTTDTPDTFEICFSTHVPHNQHGIRQEFELKLKKGFEAKNYEGIGEVAKLKPVELELKRLEGLSEEIVTGFARMRKNEEDMRDTNEATNSRVLYFSIFSMLCLLGLATWQVFYLRRFFRAKKLIE
ncbi:hypothetical protein QAD02_005257 [Eretmocerus hayati]|uniref:Uncharacterized protein n=1 Tax=Eretmocerus hayati TaxID=131215 RepID=A0ACC2NWS1_9HYME|nr:hypothetical protein QAD02_005257 [Eretmocerus hayati]